MGKRATQREEEGQRKGEKGGDLSKGKSRGRRRGGWEFIRAQYYKSSFKIRRGQEGRGKWEKGRRGKFEKGRN